MAADVFAFAGTNVTFTLKHATTVSDTEDTKSVKYVFTDAHIYGQPVWSWADDYSSATAAFTCTDSRCKHEETVDATVTTDETTEKITYTATVQFEGKTYTDKKEVDNEIGTRLIGYTLSLDGDIGVNFYMELSDQVIADKDSAYMMFTIPYKGPSGTEIMRVCDADTKEMKGKTYYIFMCRVAAKDMTGTIKAQIIDGEKNGTEYSYSAKEYADYLLAHPENEEFAAAADLVKKMLNYGAYAQIYFSDEPLPEEELANYGLSDEDKALGDVSITPPETSLNLPAGVTLEGITLALKSQTSLSLYFKSENNHELTFSCGDMTGVKEETGGYQIARIRDIPAKCLKDSFTLTVTAGANSGTAKYSPMNYCSGVLQKAVEKPEESDPKLVNVVKALYNYSQAANRYFK